MAESGEAGTQPREDENVEFDPWALPELTDNSPKWSGKLIFNRSWGFFSRHFSQISFSSVLRSNSVQHAGFFQIWTRGAK